MNKLILLNGSAGVGKSTIAKMYIDSHPLALSIESDQIIGMIGCWRQNEAEARKLKLRHVLSLIESHLETGNDVILPYLVTDATHVTLFAEIAKKHVTAFYETVLLVSKEEATERLLDRGVWGEAGSKQLTIDDTPRIHGLYDLMIAELEKRPNVKKIIVKKDDIFETYNNFISLISN